MRVGCVEDDVMNIHAGNSIVGNSNVADLHKIHVAIVDDHPLIREGLRALLEAQPDFVVLAEAETGQEALDIAREVQPDVVLLDVKLPDISGLLVTAQLKTQWQKIVVVLLTAYDDDETIFQGMRAGASAYCSKDIAPERLFDAIRQVSQDCYIIRGKVFDKRGLQRWLESAAGDYLLSQREMGILQCVTRGLHDKEIARELGISWQTVKNYMSTILNKLDVTNRTQAAVYAVERGWIAPLPKSTIPPINSGDKHLPKETWHGTYA